MVLGSWEHSSSVLSRSCSCLESLVQSLGFDVKVWAPCRGLGLEIKVVVSIVSRLGPETKFLKRPLGDRAPSGSRTSPRTCRPLTWSCWRQGCSSRVDVPGGCSVPLVSFMRSGACWYCIVLEDFKLVLMWLILSWWWLSMVHAGLDCVTCYLWPRVNLWCA